MIKETYESVEIEIYAFETEDVITESVPTEYEDDETEFIPAGL